MRREFLLFALLVFAAQIVHAEEGQVTDEDPVLGDTCTTPELQGAQCGLLVCRGGKCSQCQKDAECEITYSKFHCNKGSCKHKPLFPLESTDIIATLLMLIIIAAASGGGGIGGGGALVPLYVLVAGFRPAGAIPLSKATIFGGAVANLLLNIRKRHPTADRPLIDFHLATLFVPMQLLGTMVGVLCNKTFPNWLIIVCLIVFLTWLTRVTFQKGLVIYHMETGEQEAAAKMTFDDDKSPLIVREKSAAEIAEERQRHLLSVGGEQLQAIYRSERTCPWSKVFLLCGVWILIILIALLKGGEAASIAGIPCNSLQYWLLFFVPFPIIFALALALGRQARLLHHKKEALGYDFQPGDVRWTARNSIIYPLLNIGVGFGSGALGIGGGTMTGPLMLHLLMNPQVISGTASFMILFTSSITSAQFIIFGVLEPTYGLWLASFGFLASIIGQTVMAYILKKYKRQSIVVFCIAGILGLSGILLGFQGIRRIVIDLNDKAPMGFRPLCGLAP